MATRIGIAGVTGRMGLLLVEETRAAGADLAGGIGRPGSAKPIPAGVELYPDIAALAAASDVVVDFTHASTAQADRRGDGRVRQGVGTRHLRPVRGGRGSGGRRRRNASPSSMPPTFPPA